MATYLFVVTKITTFTNTLSYANEDYRFVTSEMEGIYGRDGENVVFIVMYEEIDIIRISEEMRACLELESYLAYPQEEDERPHFWKMLIRALLGNRNRLFP